MKELSKRKQEIRQIVLDIVFHKEKVTYDPNQYAHLAIGVAEVLQRKKGQSQRYMGDAQLDEPDATILLEVFWDLILERILTPGLDDANRELPRFRVHSEAKARLNMN